MRSASLQEGIERLGPHKAGARRSARPAQRWRWVVAALGMALLPVAGCSVEPEAGGGEPGIVRGREGEMGIVHVGALECFPGEREPVPGPAIYVSPQGDEGNSGATQEEALRSFAQAACRLLPGQTLRVLPGTYRESVVLGLFGEPGEPIRIQGVEREGQRPVLDGGERLTFGLALVESQNIVVENLEFRRYTDEGMLVLLGSDIVIRNNRFLENGRDSIEPDNEGEGFGLNLLGAQKLLVEGNEAGGNGPSQARRGRGLLGTGINTFELQSSIIRRNYSHNNIGGGILVEDGRQVLVEGNRIEGNWLDAAGDYWDGGIWVDGGQDITLRDNLISANHGPGVVLSDEEVRYPESSFGYLFEGNVVRDNLFGLHIWNFGQCPLPPEDVLRMAGNTIEGNQERDIWCQAWACGDGMPCGD